VKIEPPWYFCCGWWSPWCLIDEHWHRHFDPFPRDDEDGFDWGDAMDTEEPEGPGWLCRMHDRATERYLRKTKPEYFEEDAYQE
jgi:hypothetical protein